MARYASTIFCGSLLLFVVQPMMARYILPWFGGSPAVWTTSMLFFQLALLLGYAYTHLGAQLRPRTQGWLHVGLLVGSLLGALGTDSPLDLGFRCPTGPRVDHRADRHHMLDLLGPSPVHWPRRGLAAPQP